MAVDGNNATWWRAAVGPIVSLTVRFDGAQLVDTLSLSGLDGVGEIEVRFKAE
jgi:hypothetical protein